MKRPPVVLILVLALALALVGPFAAGRPPPGTAAQGATPLATAAGDDGGLMVRTPSGALRGIARGAVAEWRAVPYAAAPVGDRRWRPPAPVDPWAGVRDATQFAEPCPQLDLANDQRVIGREDCLYLNVFAPAGAPAGAPLPVMVHLHGGGNSFTRPNTNADAFVARGVVVVTVAYRLGVLGFAGHPAFSAEGGGPSGEYALLDQLAALAWVRDTIAAFGGDPTNVTLFGYSAGSADAIALVASPLARGLFQRAVLPTAWPEALEGVPIAGAEALGSDVAEALGCAPAPDVAACLRAASAEDLVLAVGFREFDVWVGGGVLPGSPLDLIEAQRPSIPLLVGSNREEAAWIEEPYGTAEWSRDTDALVGPARGAEARALYPPDRYDSHLWASIALYSDAIFTCPMRGLALTADGPVWRYLYTHRLENDPDLAKLRAAHILDDALLWQNPAQFAVVRLFNGLGPAPSPYAFTPAEEGLAARMADYWTNFAKTGDPNGPGVPPWPGHDATGERTLVLDTVVDEVSFYHREECAFVDALPGLFPAPGPAATPAGTPTS